MSCRSNTTFEHTDGFDWDIQSDSFGILQLGITNGENDAFHSAMPLIVNGTSVNPQAAMVDGRGVNTQPILIGGVAL